MSVLVNILSGEKLQNLIPTVQLKPNLVYLLDSGEMEYSGSVFQYISKIDHEIVNYESFDLDQNLAVINKIITDHQGEEIIFNIAGGTKFMNVIPILQSENHDNVFLLYVDTKMKEIIKFSIQNEKASELIKIPFDLECAKEFLTFDNYFALSDTDIKSYDKALTQVESNRRNAAIAIYENRELADQLKRLEIKDRRSAKFDRKYFYGWDGDDAHIMTKNNKRLDFVTTFATIGGPKEEQFLSGSWFEELVFTRLNKLFQENVYKNIVINNTNNNKDQNELDCLVIKGFNSALIECKTGKVTQDHIIKLHTLCRQVGGLFGKAILISYNNVSNQVTQIAKTVKVNIIDCQKELLNDPKFNLAEAVRKIMG